MGGQVKLAKDELEALFEAKVFAKGADKDGEGADGEADDGTGGGPGGGPRKKRVVVLLSANRSQTIGVLLSHLKAPAPARTRTLAPLALRVMRR